MGSIYKYGFKMGENIKLYAINSTALAVSFTNVESVMKIFLLAISIIYTCIQIYKILIKKTDANK